MSNTSNLENHLESITTAIVGSPFKAVDRSVLICKKALSKTKVVAEIPVAIPVPVSLPATPSAQPKMLIAERVHCSIMGNLKVCFYHYRTGFIKAVARKKGVTKEVFFTPEIAQAKNLAYTMQGAIEWVRSVGFSREIKESIPTPLPQAQPIPQLVSEVPVQQQAVVKPSVAKQQVLNSSMETYNKPPMVGTVLFMGSSVRPGFNGGAAYTTFVVKVRAEYGNVEREFMGEHLAELTEHKNVQVGDKIKIQLLGRNYFTVLVGDKEEPRNRKEYSLEVL